MNNIDFNIKLLEKNNYTVILKEDYLEIKREGKKYDIMINEKYFIYNENKYSYNNRIIDIIEEIYVVDNIKSTNIYYITNNKLKFSDKTIDKNNIYIIKFDKFLTYELKEIKEMLDCNYNVYIYVECDNNMKITEHFNELLNQFVLINNKRLLNITIVNYTEDVHSIIFNFKKHNDNVFKKIINIFPYNKPVLVNTNFENEYNKFYNSYIAGSFIIQNYNNKLNKKQTKYIAYKPNTYNIYEFNNLQGGKSKKEEIIKEFHINFITFTNIIYKKKTKLIYTGDITQIWWYKYYFDKPLCSYGRLLQSSGTCWCNAVLNILFLSDKFNKLIINAYYKEKRKNIKLKEIVNSNYKLEELFFALVYNLLIKRRKVYNYHGDIVLELAARIKGIYSANDEFYYKKSNSGIKYGEGGYTYYGFNVLMSLFLINNQWLNPMNYYTLENNNQTKLKLSDLKQLKNLNYLNVITPEEKELFLTSKIELPTHIELSHLSKLSKEIPELKYLEYLKPVDNIILNYKKNDLSYKIQYQIINKYNNIKLYTNKKAPIYFVVDLYSVITNTNVISISKEILINDIQFILINSTIIINYNNGTHAISGLMCDNNTYIYDSQNNIIKDDWINGSLKNYEEFEQEKYGNNNFRQKYFETIIYINSLYI